MRRGCLPPRFILVALVLCSCHTRPTHAQIAAGTMLAEDAAGEPHAFVVMDNGDVYRSDFGQRTTGGIPQLPWTLACNLFSAGGPPSRVVGVGGGTALTSAGGTYRIGISAGAPCYAIFDGLIAHALGQSFVTIGSNESVNGCFVYAVTDAGHVYRAWVGCGGSGWEDAGTLPIGATSSVNRSWGALKSIYR